MAAVGDLVMYMVSDRDGEHFLAQSPLRRPGIDGFYPSPGDVLPATVVKVHGRAGVYDADATVNLHVLLDGAASVWVQDVAPAVAPNRPGFWPR